MRIDPMAELIAKSNAGKPKNTLVIGDIMSWLPGRLGPRFLFRPASIHSRRAARTILSFSTGMVRRRVRGRWVSSGSAASSSVGAGAHRLEASSYLVTYAPLTESQRLADFQVDSNQRPTLTSSWRESV